MRPWLLDLFSGAGGAAKGYADAGFEVVGVDIEPQPNYPFEFIKDDALAFLQRLVSDNEVGRALGRPLSFDAIHASPPCQGYLNLGGVNRALGRANDHLRLIAPVRDMLVATGLPYVIENVPDARWALRDSRVQLCGSSFGLAVRRHRLFESNVPLMALPCAHHLQREPKYWTGWRPNGEKRLASVVQVYGNAGGREDWPAAMDIDWMSHDELAEAIPPAYTEHIGSYLMAEVKARKEVAA